MIIFLICSGLSLVYAVERTVFSDLDDHLEFQKSALLYRLKHENIDLGQKHIFGVKGSQEWVEVIPWKGDSTNLPQDQFSNVILSNIGQLSAPKEYRQLKTISLYKGHPFAFIYLESVLQWKEIIMNIVIVTFGLLFLFMIILYTFNSFLFKRLLNPFYSTVKKLSVIHDSSGFSTTFPPSTTDEIDELHTALNKMLKKLSAYFEEQKEFIQNALHELQTPLTIIFQKAESLLSKPDLDEHTFRELVHIQESTSRLSRLSKALLLISRIENKQFTMSHDISIRSIIQDVVKELNDFTESLNINIEIDIKDDLVIKGNKELIHALFYNLVQNSVKFSKENSSIWIQNKKEREKYIVQIKDSGKGIPPHMISHIFKRFKKDVKYWNESPGLGLAIVKSICDLHSFECHVESKENVGTTFSIFITNN